MTRSTAPRHIVNRYLRGGCFVLAILLHRQTGLPLWGMRTAPNGGIEHAFVADPDRGVGIDIRGEMQIERISEGARLQNPHFGPVTEDEIMAQVFSFDPAEVREAQRVIKAHLVGLPEKSRTNLKVMPPDQDGMSGPE